MNIPINKYIWSIVVLLALALGAVYVISQYKADTSSPIENKLVACTADAKICPDGSSVGRSGPNCQFAVCPAPIYVWTFESVTASTTPQTSVALTVGGKRYSAGTYEGTCFTIKGSSWSLYDDTEKSGAICFFAGAGTELGVFEENGKLILKKGGLDEGDAETPGTRGNFQTLLVIGAQ